MDISIKKVRIENFKGIKELTLDFSNKSEIRGQNASGKSSVFDAVTWVLFNKNSLGVEKFDVRPLDADGNLIHYLEIFVAVTFLIDGNETEISKRQKEKWVKSRGQENAEFSGNVNEFAIDGFPRSEKEYKVFIGNLINEDLFKMLSNPLYFPTMKWKEQRDILMKLANKESDVEIAKRLGGFDELIPDLEKALVPDDIRNKYGKAKKELTDLQKELPVRIDELERQKVDIDVAELELQKKALEEKLSGLGDHHNDVIAIEEEIFRLDFDINECVRKANESLMNDKSVKTNALYQTKAELTNAENELNMLISSISTVKATISKNTESLSTLGEQYKSRKAEVFDDSKWVFDESSTVCSLCGQTLPKDKIDALKTDFSNRKNRAKEKFESEKNADCERLLTDGYRIKGENEMLKTKLEESTKLNESLASKVSTLKANVNDIQAKLDSLPASVDLSGNDEYNNLMVKKAELKTRLENFVASENTNDGEKAIIKSDIADVDMQISKAMNNVAIDERIGQLKEELKSVAQKIADTEKMLFLFENFTKAKLENISATINGHFKMVNWKLFATQINGGVSECCECTVNGVPFSSLNSACRIQAGLDIISTLSGIYNSNVFVFIDNRESCTNIPDMDCQTISLYVDPNHKELEVVNNG